MIIGVVVLRLILVLSGWCCTMFNANNIPDNYDYSISTERNYATDDTTYVGKFAHLRELLDHTYHSNYVPERQLLQDKLMTFFNSTVIQDEKHGLVCDVPAENWLVFTAGAMGAGKSHTLVWLSHQGIFPLESFVRVDPDALRELLPESKEYIAREASTGRLTQKEVGCMSEILTLYALQQGKNVLVDGSLRDSEWYRLYIESLRKQYQRIKTAIVHVVASEKTVFSRCKKREAITGRHVPEEVVKASMEQLPRSIALLAPFVDVVVTLENEDHPHVRSNGSRSGSIDSIDGMRDGAGDKDHGPRLIESEALKYYRENQERGTAGPSSDTTVSSENQETIVEETGSAEQVQSVLNFGSMEGTATTEAGSHLLSLDANIPPSLLRAPKDYDGMRNMFEMRCAQPRLRAKSQSVRFTGGSIGSGKGGKLSHLSNI